MTKTHRILIKKLEINWKWFEFNQKFSKLGWLNQKWSKNWIFDILWKFLMDFNIFFWQLLYCFTWQAPIGLFVFKPVNLFVYYSICLFVYWSVCQFVSLSVCQFVNSHSKTLLTWHKKLNVSELILQARVMKWFCFNYSHLFEMKCTHIAAQKNTK